jgi:hypothetical protein
MNLSKVAASAMTAGDDPHRNRLRTGLESQNVRQPLLCPELERFQTHEPETASTCPFEIRKRTQALNAIENVGNEHHTGLHRLMRDARRGARAALDRSDIAAVRLPEGPGTEPVA